MPNPASSTARNRTTHDTPTRTTHEHATSTSHATNSVISTTDQVDTTTIRTLTRIDDHTDQGQNQEQSTNRAGITMLVVAAQYLLAATRTLIRVRVFAAAGGRCGA